MKQDVRILLVGERKSATVAIVASSLTANTNGSLLYLTNLMYLFTFILT